MPGVYDQDNTAERASAGVDQADEVRRYAEAIVDAMRQPALVLNEDLRVEIANRAFYRIFQVDQADITGRLIYELGNRQWDIGELRKLLEEILPNNGSVDEFRVEREFERIGRRVMILNARRLERVDRRPAIFLTIDDITEREDTRWLLEAEKEYAEKVVDASRDALLILGWDHRVRTANETFYKTFKVDPSATEGRMVYELGNGQWDIPELRDLLENVLPDNDAFDDFEVEHDFEDLGHRIMVLNARRVDHTQLILLAIEDQTEARRAERARRESEARMASMMQHAPIGIGLIDREGRWVMQNPLLERLSSGLIPFRDSDQTSRWHPADKSDPENWPGSRALRGEIVAPGVDFRTEVDGQERWLRISAAPVQGSKEVDHAVVIAEDITEDKRGQEERELLLAELNHRVKNLFGVIRSLVTQGSGGAEVEQYKNTLIGRLDALVRAHTLVIESRWGSFDLTTLAERTLEPSATRRAAAIQIRGEPLPLEARHAVSLSLILHELATNSVKYGALSAAEGRIGLTWRIVQDSADSRAELAWQESGGPPVRAPKRRGFGTTLIERAFAYDLQGGAEIEFPPEGLRARAWFSIS
ncbi:PAS domain-containing protein [Enhydrobacter sp.]|jgi:PAS domain S-box-containing protein|uniref:sensor histidine kinase n=1 Tax=Enhydrobacter sp. TaxID=1894999 RepID=UPI002628D012|nr:PAS domain-containing protein [Enhydrobacter sp.]WIM10753.1 MAG: PAS domain-containing protein [Enhydrobacter sp.]